MTGLRTDYFVDNHGDFLSGKYTLVVINKTSNELTEDLWFTKSAPLKVKISNLLIKGSMIIYPILFIAISCLISYLTAWLVFRKRQWVGSSLDLLTFCLC